MTTEQYMALSTISYNKLPIGPKPNNGNPKPWTIVDLVKAGQIDGARFNNSTSSIVTSRPELSALSSLSSYTLIATQPNTASGFHASAFRSPSGEIVYAFAGTEGAGLNKIDWRMFAQDGSADAAIAWGTYTAQFGDAEAFVAKTQAKYGNPNYSFTGDSLGGGITQYMTAKTGKSATTFNAVGVVSNIIQAVARRLLLSCGTSVYSGLTKKIFSKERG